MDLQLTDKVAVLTGANKDIGLAITEALIAECSYVVAGSVSTVRERRTACFAAGRVSVARLLGVYPDSSERVNDSTVRLRSLLANSAATGFINRMTPKSSPSATW